MSDRTSVTRHHIHPGTSSWPDQPLPRVEQLVIRGGEKDQMEALGEILREEGLVDEWVQEQRERGTIDWAGKWQARIGRQFQAKLGKQPLGFPFPDGCWRLFPDLRRLYLWDVVLEEGDVLPELPAGLEILELNGVEGLRRIPALPSGLRTLVVQGCGAAVWPSDGAERLGRLEELVVRGVETLSQDWLDEGLAAAAGTIRKLDLSGCQRIGRIKRWPENLVDVRLNGCSGLKDLPENWPAGLRRLELRGAAELARLADFTARETALDFVDLGGMGGMRTLPDMPKWPRTLMIYDSGLELPPELHGDGPEENVSRAVRGYLEEARGGLEVNDEVKLILLGNGRCGKTSLARRITGQGVFQTEEKSTHGIHFWSYEEAFRPAGEDADATARVNVWDFAGQDLYHSTHRLFLQSKAAFLLCETRAGDGSDEATDRIQDVDHVHADLKRPMPYWRDQVDSLGHAPGRRLAAPRRIVETKINRPPRPGAPAAVEGVEIRTSAETGVGIDDALRPAVQAMIAEALGRRGERLWPVAALRVRETLQGMTADKVISRAAFDAVVRQHAVPGGAYHDDPGLVLTLLHRSGFLFASNRMPDKVVLDQRWAVEGIYTVFDREEGCWRKLEGAGGKFTGAELREWVWEKQGYSGADQAVFLEMMRSCGICFQLLPEWLTADGEAVYVAPTGLPEADWFRARVEADRYGLPETELETLAQVAEEDWRAIQVKLGEIWGRTATMWRTGVQVKAYYRPGDPRPDGDSFVALDWVREEDAYFGCLRLRGFGADGAFFTDVLKLCRTTIPGKAPEEAPPAAEPEAPVGQPTVEQRNAPKVAISFAGWEDRGAPQEQVAMELCRALQGRVTVEHYRMEQERTTGDKRLKPQKYLEHLMAADFVVVVLTGKYLRSPWCLYEAMRLHERLVDGEFNHGQMRAFAFPEVSVSPGDEAGWVGLSGELEACWAGQVAEFNAAYQGLAATKIVRKLGESDLGPWYLFASEDGNRHALAAAVLKNWYAKRLGESMPGESMPGEGTFAEWAEDILSSMTDPAPMFALAKKAWGANPRQEERARSAYLEGLRRRDGAGWPASLERPETDPELEAVRRARHGSRLPV